MKSYIEITKSCKLKDYQEALSRVETWEDTKRVYKCIWLSQNDGMLPTTITYENKLD